MRFLVFLPVCGNVSHGEKLEVVMNMLKRGCNFVFGALWGIGAVYYVLCFMLVFLKLGLPGDMAEVVVSMIGSPLAGVATPYFAHFAVGNSVPFKVH
jgi:hypothetical protein